MYFSLVLREPEEKEAKYFAHGAPLESPCPLLIQNTEFLMRNQNVFDSNVKCLVEPKTEPVNQPFSRLQSCCYIPLHIRDRSRFNIQVTHSN